MGLVQIDEPIGFDASQFITEQRDNGYGRDNSFSGDETEFTFSSQNNLFGQYFDKLIEYDKEYGFESEVDYILREGATDYVVGSLDYYTKRTDEIYDFTCTIIQSTTQALIKRREAAKVKLFSDEDLDGNPIAPIATENILIKAKPVVQVSLWEYTPINFSLTNFGFQQFVGFPLFNNIKQSRIEDTLTAFQNYQAKLTEEPDFLEGYREDISFIKAKSDLSNIKVKISNLSFNSIGTSNVAVRKTLSVNYGSSYVAGEFTSVKLEETDDNQFGVSDADYEVDIPFVPNGGFIFINFSMLDLSPTGGATPTGSFSFTLTSGELEITATSTAIPSVSKGVRLINAMNQVSSSINQDFNLSAPRFESGGEWYDNFVFSGNMVRGKDVFVLDWETIVNGLQEFNSDYEVNENNIFVGKYDDYYENTEIGVFPIKPNESFNTTFNERYAINQFEFKYKNYNQDKDDKNTIDAVHTESEWLNANKRVENFKQIEIDFIRDPFLLETTRRKAIAEDSSSLTEDDKVFIVDVVRIAPNAKEGFSSLVTHFVNNDGDLQLLNDGTFNWGLLGFNVGATFQITDTDNVGAYSVTEITNNILTLTGGSPPIFWSGGYYG